jgi:hypothetical protein
MEYKTLTMNTDLILLQDIRQFLINMN